MTIHPLLRLIATQPQLLADHAEAYAGLVGDEFGKSLTAWKWRMLLNAVALVSMAVAAVLAGLSLMLWAVVVPASAQAHWALIAAPTAPALVAIVCLFASRRKPRAAFAELKQQLAADLNLLREVSPA